MTILRALAAAPLTLAMIAPSAAFAQEAEAAAETGISHTFDLTYVSDYVYRGISNSNEDFAIQPAYTLTYTSAWGVEYYAGLWGSTLDPEVSAPDKELDIWVGAAWSTSFADFGAYITHFAYPGTPDGSDLAYSELQLTAGKSAGPLYLSAEYDFSPDYYHGTGDAHYASIGFETNEDVLPAGLIFSAHVGKQYFDDNAAFGTPDYADGGFGLSKSLTSWLSASVAYTDTDMSTTECFGGLEICSDRVFFTLTASATPNL